MKGSEIDSSPSYLNLSKKDFRAKTDRLYQMLNPCGLCPRNCGVNRINGEKGACNSNDKIKISSVGAHFGEEPPLVGRGGSGAIFLTNCNLNCVFCQNYEISQMGRGDNTSLEQLATHMLNLQKRGCHNINLVTPTHFAPQLVEAIFIASKRGLKLPVVWNCGGYESPEVIETLEGIIDIYMPDIKYGSDKNGKKYSKVEKYFTHSKRAIKKMHNQVGDLIIENGIATRGLLIRHLVLPNQISRSEEVLRFIAKDISTYSYINIMDQYHPCYKANGISELSRRLKREEFMETLNIALRMGFSRSL